MGSALLPTRRSADGRFRGALPRESLPRRRQRCRRDNQRAASPWPPRAGPPEPRAVLPQRKPRRVCPNSVQTRITMRKSRPILGPQLRLMSKCTCDLSPHLQLYVVRWKWEGQERAARTAGDGRPTPTAAGHSAAVADALEDEGWPGCQGSRASATGYDRALLALSRVLNPKTRATRRHTASMHTFDESLAWPLRTLRSA